MKKLFITISAAVALAAMLATPATAHVSITARSPAAGGSAKKTLATVTVTFNSALRSGTLKVFRVSTGAKVSIGNGGRDPRNLKRLRVSLKSGKSTGQYVARWTLVAADGHSQSGSWRFRLTN
jgi:methionine-rich copper-binding protein CopC